MSTSDQDQTLSRMQGRHSSTETFVNEQREAGELTEAIDQSLDRVGNELYFEEKIKGPFLQAGKLQMQGEYTQALELYQQLINLAIDLEVSTSSTDQDSLYYLASAFQNLVKIRSSLPEQSTTELLKVIDSGLKWLERVQKSGWSASLRLQKSLLHCRWKGHLEEAYLELQDALELALGNRDAPGYHLAIFQLKLADLLCTIAGHDANSELWPLAYTRESTKSAANIRHLLAQLNRDTSRVVEAINTLDSTISTISSEAIKLVKNPEEQREEMYVHLNAAPTDRQLSPADQQHTICFVALPFN